MQTTLLLPVIMNLLSVELVYFQSLNPTFSNRSQLILFHHSPKQPKSNEEKETQPPRI
ncbi:hypothetical protein ES288_D10G061100v1 [Gossypium darwinii]|uniref:Uncharacterized protein n=1 Tax=Gossypium darwinii TaxID=34276 RepID=A0A5D2AW21_GOSDA|nr:hypothetical protein ES288_D10G061100v1 [Gossypium darwinii]